MRWSCESFPGTSTRLCGNFSKRNEQEGHVPAAMKVLIIRHNPLCDYNNLRQSGTGCSGTNSASCLPAPCAPLRSARSMPGGSWRLPPGTTTRGTIQRGYPACCTVLPEAEEPLENSVHQLGSVREYRKHRAEVSANGRARGGYLLCCSPQRTAQQGRRIP